MASSSTSPFVRIGCSGWNYAHWRDGVFYPPGLPPRRWLAHYAKTFDTVEVNSTFYRLPRREAVANWVRESPADFLFTIKASRYLTHVKRLTDLESGVGIFWDRIAPLLGSPKMGPVLWQFPPTFARHTERLADALERLPEGRHCFEFRHESWFVPETYELLRRHGAALVIGDHPARPWQAHELTTDWTFIRFHYGTRGRNGNYSERELDAWAQRIEGWRETVDVYAYFNNDWEGYALANASHLMKRLGIEPSRSVPSSR